MVTLPNVVKRLVNIWDFESESFVCFRRLRPGRIHTQGRDGLDAAIVALYAI